MIKNDIYISIQWQVQKAMAILKIKKEITFIVLLVTSMCFSQNDCIDFSDFEESQKWINEINKLDIETKKVKILERIECESTKNNFKFFLLLIIEGRLYNIKYSCHHDLKMLNIIKASEFKLMNSNCYSSKVFYEKCNLGYVLIEKLKEPILHEINSISFKEIRKKKNKIILKMVSQNTVNIEIKKEPLFSQETRIYLYKTRLKKGKNRIVLKTSDSLNSIEINKENKKSIIII